MDLARAPRRAPLTARKKGSGYENGAWYVRVAWRPVNISQRWRSNLLHHSEEVLISCVFQPFNMDFSMDFSEIAEGKVLNFSLFSD